MIDTTNVLGDLTVMSARIDITGAPIQQLPHSCLCCPACTAWAVYFEDMVIVTSSLAGCPSHNISQLRCRDQQYLINISDAVLKIKADILFRIL